MSRWMDRMSGRGPRFDDAEWDNYIKNYYRKSLLLRAYVVRNRGTMPPGYLKMLEASNEDISKYMEREREAAEGAPGLAAA